MVLRAVCLIKRDDLVLMLKESPTFGYDLPGGIVEQKETYEEAAIRETREETGLIVTHLTPGVIMDHTAVFNCEAAGTLITVDPTLDVFDVGFRFPDASLPYQHPYMRLL